jgi:hypothetical protein
MSESEKLLPLDETLWDYIKGMDGTLGIPVSDTKTLDLIGALYDIYWAIKSDVNEAESLVIGLTALLLAAPLGQAEKVWQELIVNDSMKNFELQAKKVLDEPTS